MEAIKRETRKANKNHICSWCGSGIYKGETYSSDSIVGDDGFYTWKSCEYCKGIVAAMFKEYEDNGDGLTSERFDEYISDNKIPFERR